ncbi:hyaluronidase-4-like isoform X3 [Panthera tigris]|uniref:hyaluronidase-4-like isoform X3 n=1 Tax=Panthera tigris TaxID=9694 RepID=UPI001C6F9C5D|nr:hyaluronidase-4-like isoform X3 [Panthera tigris]
MYNLWMAWSGVLLPLIKFTHSVLKPVLPPVIKNQPFNMFWAAPTMQCQHFFNVDLNLPLFNIIANPVETQRGSTIAIFYPNELGYYPYFSQDGKPFNGGIPQNMSLSKHLRKTADDIAKVVSWWRSEGLVVIDWESWKPQWDRNWGKRIIYKNHSLAFTRNRHPDWSEMKVKTIAQQEFESAGRSFMNTTLTLALEMRPKCLWGFYLYPDCYNYDYRTNPQIYTGKCPNDEISRNDQLQWLWEKSTALYTSIYLDKILKSSLNALKFVHYRVREAIRIAEMARHDYILPVFIFSRPFYLHSLEALSQEDLVHTIGESAALGAAGIILWGGYEYSDSKSRMVICSDDSNEVQRVWGRTLFEHLLCSSHREGLLNRAKVYPRAIGPLCS